MKTKRIATRQRQEDKEDEDEQDDGEEAADMGSCPVNRRQSGTLILTDAWITVSCLSVDSAAH